MGIESFSISLGNGNDRAFYPGEMLSGYCDVTVVDRDADVSGIVVKLLGIAKISWAETCTTSDSSGTHAQVHTFWYINSLDIVTAQQQLVVQAGFLPQGRHRLPFAFQLRSDLPSSFEGSYGNIRYWLEASVSSSVKLPKTVTAFKICQPIYLDRMPHYSLPVEGSVSKSLCCCFYVEGPLSVDVKLDRKAYCAGDIVSISGNFENGSLRKVKPYAKLVQRQTILANGGLIRRHLSSWPLLPVSGTPPQNFIRRRSSLPWTDVHFFIPDVPPSTVCPILEVSYYIEVGLTIPGAVNLRTCLPVIIGITADDHKELSAGGFCCEKLASTYSQQDHHSLLTSPTLMFDRQTSYNSSVIGDPPPSYCDTMLAINDQTATTSE